MMKIIICTALVVSCSKMFLEHINDNNRCFILKWPPSDSLAFVIRHKHNKWGSNNVHYLEKFPSLLFNFLHLLFEVFLGPRPIGCDPLEMHMLQLTRFWGHLNQQQSKRKKKARATKGRGEMPDRVWTLFRLTCLCFCFWCFCKDKSRLLGPQESSDSL